MSNEVNAEYKDIIKIIESNIVYPAANNNKFSHKAFIVGNNILHIMLDLSAKTLHIIRHDGKGRKYNNFDSDEDRKNIEQIISEIFEACEKKIEKQNQQIEQRQEKMQNFSEHQKILEQVKYIASIPESVLSIENAGGTESQYGVAYVKHFTYSTRNTSIQYSKWIVECYNSAKYMHLHGYDKHDQLVKGSSVKFLRKKNGHVYNFYGKEAEEIIKTCENLHMQEILTKTNNLQR